jgi:hypothetical protein
MIKTILVATLTFASALIPNAILKAQTFQWANSLSSQSNDYSNAIDVDSAGNSFITGSYYNTITIGGITLSATNLWSLYIAKYDKNGILVWARTVAKASSTTARLAVSGICVEKAGRIALGGHFSDSSSFGITSPITLRSSGDLDAFIATFDKSGNLIFAKAMGEAGADFIAGVSTDTKGNFFIGGDFHYSSYSGSASKIVVAKYDSIGNQVWLKKTLKYGSFCICKGIKADTSGSTFIAGQFFNDLTFDSATILSAPHPEANLFVGKLDIDGNTSWLRQAGAATGYIAGNAIDVDKQGNCFVTGLFRGTVAFGTSNLSGQTVVIYDAFTAKYGRSGNLLWVQKTNGYGAQNMGLGISSDDVGGCAITGYFSSQISFGPINLSDTGANRVFIAKLNSSGQYDWANQCGGPLDCMPFGIKVHSQEVFVTGNYLGTMYFGKSISIAGNPSNYDAFIAKLSYTTGIEKEKGPEKSALNVYPNPSSDFISLTGHWNGAHYTVYTAIGEKLLDGKIGRPAVIFVGNIPAGSYFIRVISPSGNFFSAPFIKR